MQELYNQYGSVYELRINVEGDIQLIDVGQFRCAAGNVNVAQDNADAVRNDCHCVKHDYRIHDTIRYFRFALRLAKFIIALGAVVPIIRHHRQYFDKIPADEITHDWRDHFSCRGLEITLVLPCKRQPQKLPIAKAALDFLQSSQTKVIEVLPLLVDMSNQVSCIPQNYIEKKDFLYS